MLGSRRLKFLQHKGPARAYSGSCYFAGASIGFTYADEIGRNGDLGRNDTELPKLFQTGHLRNVFEKHASGPTDLGPDAALMHSLLTHAGGVF